MALFINEQIILANTIVKNSVELFQLMGKKLSEAGLVSDEFTEEIIRREEQFPTGLPTNVPISLCHTDSEFIKQPFLTLATLTTPIPFQEMGNPEKVHWVKIAFFLGIKDNKEHIVFLKKIMDLIRSGDVLESIYESKSTSQIKKILMNNLF